MKRKAISDSHDHLPAWPKKRSKLNPPPSLLPPTVSTEPTEHAPMIQEPRRILQSSILVSLVFQLSSWASWIRLRTTEYHSQLFARNVTEQRTVAQSPIEDETAKEASAQRSPNEQMPIDSKPMESNISKKPDGRSGSEVPFKYTPLDRSTQSIRLVRILPRDSDKDELQCQFRHAQVDATYTCLSYVWGPKDLKSRILLDGQVLRVSQNLMDFLLYAATRDTSQWYWIDALCINQLSVAERNHQVQQMGLIYSKAQSVLAWLGTDTKIAQFLAKPTTSGSRFYAFWSSPYWDRAWITQEIALAFRVTLVAGNRELDMKELPFFNRTSRIDDVNLSRLSALNPAKSHSLRSKSLIQLLHKFRFKECERSRDRVYSLLALCGAGSDIPVDYGIPSDELAGQILRSCHHSLCLCSVRTVSKVLGITDGSPCSLASALPFAEIDIPHVRAGECVTQKDHFSVDLRLICPAYHGSLEVDVDANGAIPWFGYRERWGNFVKTSRGSSTCSVQLLKGDKATICLSLIVLLDIARLARLAQFSDGVCKRKSVASIRLWKPRLQAATTKHTKDGELKVIHSISKTTPSETTRILEPESSNVIKQHDTSSSMSPVAIVNKTRVRCRCGGGGGGRGGYN